MKRYYGVDFEKQREKLLKNYLTHQSVRNFKIVQIFPETDLFF